VHKEALWGEWITDGPLYSVRIRPSQNPYDWVFGRSMLVKKIIQIPGDPRAVEFPGDHNISRPAFAVIARVVGSPSTGGRLDNNPTTKNIERPPCRFHRVGPYQIQQAY
jgi:hypothetical protein